MAAQQQQAGETPPGIAVPSHPDGRCFALSGPSAVRDPRQAVRSDLAHIKFVGTVFAPYYAVPMPHRAGPGGAAIFSAARGGVLTGQLAAGARFDVLDMAGGWCWGEAAEAGVGYVQASELSPA